MNVEHALEITAICPVDHLPDVYRCVVRTGRMLPVERILAAAKALATRELYQEDVTLALHRELAADVETIGWHSGVMTRVRAGNGVSE